MYLVTFHHHYLLVSHWTVSTQSIKENMENTNMEEDILELGIFKTDFFFFFPKGTE